MTLSLSTLDFLASDRGRRLLDKLAAEDLSEANTLRLLSALRRDYPPEHAGAALELARLRIRAAEKFGADATRMFFTAEALEQASSPLIRRYRAGAAQGRRVLDACCGIGSDSLAFAPYADDVLGLDIDMARVAIARYNAAALGIANARFEVADVRDGVPQADLIFFDPARRDSGGRRIYDVERYQPPLSVIRQWRADHILVKLSPGVDLMQLGEYGGMVEFISVKGDLKEALLWLASPQAEAVWLEKDKRAQGAQTHFDPSSPFSGLGSSVAGRFNARRGKRTKLSTPECPLISPQGEQSLVATLLTDTQVYHWQRAESPENTPLSEPRAWLVEPDPALLRAGLVQDAAASAGGFMLDETIAYFTTDSQPDSPWLRAWRVLDWMPFNLKRLRAYLRQHNVGAVTVKKRGSPIAPEELIPKLKLKGDQSRTLVLTRCRGKPVVVICADFDPLAG